MKSLDKVSLPRIPQEIQEVENKIPYHWCYPLEFEYHYSNITKLLKIFLDSLKGRNKENIEDFNPKHIEILSSVKFVNENNYSSLVEAGKNLRLTTVESINLSGAFISFEETKAWIKEQKNKPTELTQKPLPSPKIRAQFMAILPLPDDEIAKDAIFNLTASYNDNILKNAMNWYLLNIVSIPPYYNIVAFINKILQMEEARARGVDVTKKEKEIINIK